MNSLIRLKEFLSNIINLILQAKKVCFNKCEFCSRYNMTCMNSDKPESTQIYQYQVNSYSERKRKNISITF